ncbi:ATP-binding protein [Bradyrhizobium sp. 174]|uniref:ATP-binding protein n=1 Tax=Bradyrhizobium sp. 174 TaxID=2782645 RepID=UPI001FF94D5A|nr:ATP-binding protein [Bradyrhizobium sp. 174]MCK1571408.1 response regulator [Bradyrhizobium sp. 174]
MARREHVENGPALVLAPVGRDAAVICSMLQADGTFALEQRSLTELVGNLGEAAAAVIAEEALTHEDRGSLARWILNQPPWSDFPFVLLTLRAARNPQPDLVELLGNVTVLERPLAAASLKSAVKAAVRARVKQRQTESYLDQLTHLTDSLERRIEDRTHELANANRRLMAEMVERERTEVALRHAHKMEAVGQLTGGIAHDFNNLLTTIMGNLQLLGLRIEDERLQRYLRNAMHGAERGAKLVKQLMAFSRKQHLAPEPIDINELAGVVAELLSRTIGTGIRLEVATQEGLWPALVDPTQLELMLLNLAFNARDAMPTGGTIVIETTALNRVPDQLARELKAGQYVCISVKDTGTGMPPDVLARAFDPFFTTKAPGKGTGLGLSQVYGFARQSGGTVKIETELGRGTVVRIFLPRSTKAVVAGQGSSEPTASARGTALVIDDDADVRETTGGMLETLGYRVVATDDLEAALAALGRESVDLALVDLAMPKISGVDVGRQLRQRSPRLPILFCSGFPDLIEENRKRISKEAFLSKPYSLADLAAKIEAISGAKPIAVDPSAAVMNG